MSWEAVRSEPARVGGDRHIGLVYSMAVPPDNESPCGPDMVKLNTLVRPPTGYDPPSVPKSLCNPRTLADLLIDARAWRKEAFWSDGAASEAAAPLSDDAVRKLIDLAFYTSLAPEEGRHPRFKLVSQKFRS